PTLAAGLAGSAGSAVQVTRSGVFLLQVSSGGAWRQSAEWLVPPSAVISAASVSGDQIAAAVDGSLVVYLEARGSALVLVAERRLAHSVACIDVHSWRDAPSGFVAVGLWAAADADVCLLAVPTLQPVLALHVTGGLARSLRMCALGGAAFVVVGGGDGRLHHLAISHDLHVTERRTLRLGARPVALAGVAGGGVAGGVAGVFAASDHAAMLYAGAGGRLLCASVDAQGVRCAASVRSRALPDALLLLVSDAGLGFAAADAAQRLHVRSRPLPPYAAPHRLAFSAALGVYAVATIHDLRSADHPDLAGWAQGPGADVDRPLPAEAARLSVLAGGAQPGHVLASLLLHPFESPESLCVAPIPAAADPGADPAIEECFVLGTSVVLPGDDDAKRGRVLALQWDARTRRISELASFAALGAVYALVPFRAMLLAAIGNRLLLLAWQAGGLAPLCSQQTQIAALSVAVNGDYVIVGDVMASVSVYRYEESGGRHRLVPVARDYAGVWTTCVAAVPAPLPQNIGRVHPPVSAPLPLNIGRAYPPPPAFLEEEEDGGSSISRTVMPQHAQALRDPSCERFIVADAYNNIFRVALSPAASTSTTTAAELQQRLFVEARWHLSDQINVIRSGSLVMDVPDPEFPDVFRASLVFGTVQGAIGVIASVEDARIARILDRLQVNMSHLLPTPGMWDYDEWRSYASDQRMSRAFGVLDGDLIERFLDLPPEVRRLVFEGGGLLGKGDVVERKKRAAYWADHARVEAEAEVAVLGQMTVSDIAQWEDGVTLDYVVRLVECLARLH
ncbi:DNA damage-binding protein 1a, partial [Coemansia sp. BCRC 34301]